MSCICYLYISAENVHKVNILYICFSSFSLSINVSWCLPSSNVFLECLWKTWNNGTCIPNANQGLHVRGNTRHKTSRLSHTWILGTTWVLVEQGFIVLISIIDDMTMWQRKRNEKKENVNMTNNNLQYAFFTNIVSKNMKKTSTCLFASESEFSKKCRKTREFLIVRDSPNLPFEK